MLSKLAGFHIEPTNMCTLGCPQCSRTKFISKFPKAWTNKNINLDNLKNFIDVDLTGMSIKLCGNYGDPIYYPRIFELVEYFKNNNTKIVISTNGSHKNLNWWERLADLLDYRDTIIFGIDGLPENFTKYRINADWDSIKIGIDALAVTDINTEWQYIPFSFNENDIEQARMLSIELGLNKFSILPSDRWEGEDDWLRPLNQKGLSLRNESIIKWKQDNIRDITIQTPCKELNNKHFISAGGFYTPCCYSSDHNFYYQSEFYKNRDMYDISKTTISQLLSSIQSKNFYNTLEDAKLSYCTFNCPTT